jgi:secreted PhoX family phosphatase
MNHENINEQYLHVGPATNVSTGPRPAGEALKEIDAHGVSVVEVQRAPGGGAWGYNQNSSFNRRSRPTRLSSSTGPCAATLCSVRNSRPMAPRAAARSTIVRWASSCGARS